MPKIFVSYRRDTAESDAGRLYDQLSKRFGGKSVFRDFDAIPPGQNFQQAIFESLKTVDVFLAVIDPDWLEAADEKGMRRLDDPDDVLRSEIASALENRTRLIPVLVRGAEMPVRQFLPNELSGLAGIQAIDLREPRYAAGIRQLVTLIRGKYFYPTRGLALAICALIFVLATITTIKNVIQVEEPGNGPTPPILAAEVPSNQLPAEIRTQPGENGDERDMDSAVRSVGGIQVAEGFISQIEVQAATLNGSATTAFPHGSVITALESNEEMKLGLTLLQGQEALTHSVMFDQIRDAFGSRSVIRLEFIVIGTNTGEIIRVMSSPQ